ncbi:MAG TPA: hypothetical protein VGD62_03250 [Acidobacteriaceae bacterium]
MPPAPDSVPDSRQDSAEDSALPSELWGRTLAGLRANQLQLPPDELAELEALVKRGAALLASHDSSPSTDGAMNQAIYDIGNLVQLIANELSEMQYFEGVPSPAGLGQAPLAPPGDDPLATLSPALHRQGFQTALARFCPCFPFC